MQERLGIYMTNCETYPYFSIVIPTYNHADYLEKSIESVLDQTFSDWEILLIDNSSTDKTDEIVSRFENSKIRVFKINNCGVISKSRNLGINNSRGEWIAFLDSDDWWEPDKLFECKKAIGENIDFIYHDLWKIYNNNKIGIVKSRQLNPPILMDLLLNGNTISASSSVVRKSFLKLIGGMNEEIEMNSTADYNSWLKISELTNNFLHIPMNLGSYRIHGSNVSNNRIFESTLKAVEEFLPVLKQSQRNKIISKIIYAQGILSYNSGNLSSASNDLKASLRAIDIKRKIKALLILIRIKFSIEPKMKGD